MKSNSRFNVVVAGTGAYLPEKIVTNADLEKVLDTSDEWIRARTGIEERRIASKDECSSVMAVKAAKQALAEAGLAPDQVDMIIVCTSTPDVLYPSTACFVQNGLGASRAVAYDISAVCSGFIFGLSIAEQYLKTGRYQHILVIGSEVNSRILDWTDRSTCILFGDGAGAALLKRVENNPKASGILSSHIYSDGAQTDVLGVPGGICRTSISHEDIDNKQYCIKMVGSATFKFAVKRMSDVALEALEYNGLTPKDVNLMIPHQANKRIIDAVGEKLQLTQEQVFVNIEKYGNTAAASIPIALHEAKSKGRIKAGDLVLLNVLGAGLTWGAVLIRW
jgi:3-oxoacyl-[acyl-carrier-protein] synthase-3